MVYRWSQIRSRYNDVPVFWCDRCLSLQIVAVESRMRDVPALSCERCLGTEVSVGHIFEWIELHPRRPFRNLREYQEWKRRVDWAEHLDNYELSITNYDVIH